MIQPIPTLAPRRRTPTWLWLMLALFALSVLLVTTAFNWVLTLDHVPAHVVIDGNEVWSMDPALFTGWNRVGMMVAAVIAVFAVLVIVPIVVLIALTAALIGVVLGVGLPLVAVVLALAIALSPLWLIVLLVWWAARRSAPAAAHAA